IGTWIFPTGIAGDGEIPLAIEKHSMMGSIILRHRLR
ncbi:hypothetical protein ALC62_02827, partial [Cyphomyrmex costatus]